MIRQPSTGGHAAMQRAFPDWKPHRLPKWFCPHVRQFWGDSVKRMSNAEIWHLVAGWRIADHWGTADGALRMEPYADDRAAAERFADAYGLHLTVEPGIWNPGWTTAFVFRPLDGGGGWAKQSSAMPDADFNAKNAVK